MLRKFLFIPHNIRVVCQTSEVKSYNRPFREYVVGYAQVCAVLKCATVAAAAVEVSEQQ